MDDKIRLGGMALVNGVLVHGPASWACAIRNAEGQLEVASAYKRLRASEIQNPLLRGPAKIAEVFALLPQVRRRLPEARLPFQRPQVLAAMAGTALLVHTLKESRRLTPLARELLGGILSLAPAAVAVRSSDLAAYHGAEHVSIGSYEHDEPRTREHERCGSHLVGPLLLTSAAGNLLAARAPEAARPLARLAAGVGALAASVEIFGWMLKNDEHPVSRALARP